MNLLLLLDKTFVKIDKKYTLNTYIKQWQVFDVKNILSTDLVIKIDHFLDLTKSLMISSVYSPKNGSPAFCGILIVWPNRLISMHRHYSVESKAISRLMIRAPTTALAMLLLTSTKS